MFKIRIINFIFVIILYNILSVKSSNINKKSIKKLRNELPNGFVFVDENNSYGPITINRKLDNGKKRNLYKIIKEEKDDFYYNYSKFDKLLNSTQTKSEFFCEKTIRYRPEGMKGYNISCPSHFSIAVEKAFYGRYANDTDTCAKRYKFTKNILNKIRKDCGILVTNKVKELCEGKVYCSILPANGIFKDKCKEVYKYLNVKYHCKKDQVLKKERIAIVMFFNNIKVNSVDENSVSDFYQYANIHGYDFYFGNYNYNPERKVYFMKFNTILEKMIEGLRDKKYDWIFWVDTDTLITNPNIRLESFLPNEKMNKVHLVVADDKAGLQAGIFFVRVHEWSLTMIMKVMTYCYFKNKKFLKYHDQSALNNVLTEYDESEHYVIVPQRWFNNNFLTLKEGDFLLHIMGNSRGGKNNIYKKYFNLTRDEIWHSKTNKEMRKEVMNYYSLPKNKQHNIIPE